MNIKTIAMSGLVLIYSVISGCSSKPLDFCSLLSIEEAQLFNAEIISSKMDIRGESAPTNYCIYINDDEKEVLKLSIGNVTDNLPYDILQTYIPYMEGENKVVNVNGIGSNAAALFSDDYEVDKLRMLLAVNDKWSVTIRASGIRDSQSSEFLVLKDLANKALTRFGK